MLVSHDAHRVPALASASPSVSTSAIVTPPRITHIHNGTLRATCGHISQRRWSGSRIMQGQAHTAQRVECLARNLQRSSSYPTRRRGRHTTPAQILMSPRRSGYSGVDEEQTASSVCLKLYKACINYRTVSISELLRPLLWLSVAAIKYTLRSVSLRSGPAEAFGPHRLTTSLQLISPIHPPTVSAITPHLHHFYPLPHPQSNEQSPLPASPAPTPRPLLHSQSPFHFPLHRHSHCHSASDWSDSSDAQ